ncbi:hypothetical protein BDFB_011348 [Asbolus verrucosus]|uniref:Uncharacterized protein n=1 Tax=Asbolus verrucosus TaxID=1661398 RepID=A0A482VXR8_ASBVE|nr:hypothetical protein BDFB_011348 [Asbolus verrucosus]
MPFSQEQKMFVLESYLRSGHKIDTIWQYNIPHCLEVFRNEFLEVVFHNDQF